MPMDIDFAALEKIKACAGDLFNGMEKDLALAGEAGAEAIVRTTLAGIGENDQPFAPYSKAYQEELDLVGGKIRGTVDLRGIFYHAGQKTGLADLGRINKMKNAQKKAQAMAARMRHEGQLVRQGALRQSFKTVKVRQTVRYRDAFGGEGVQHVTKTILVRTGLTRPARGVTDPLSEMSLDLLTVKAAKDSLRLVYTPRKEPYMLYHNAGAPHLPKRTWFTINKQGVASAMVKIIAESLRARVAAFNRGEMPSTSSSTPPPATSSPTSAPPSGP